MGRIFGDNLRAMRKANGLTQAELAQKLGVSPQAVSFWEMGSNEPTIVAVVGICKTFGCTISDLTGEEYRPITPKDREIVEAFHRAPESVQTAILTLLGIGGSNETA